MRAPKKTWKNQTAGTVFFIDDIRETVEILRETDTRDGAVVVAVVVPM